MKVHRLNRSGHPPERTHCCSHGPHSLNMTWTVLALVLCKLLFDRYTNTFLTGDTMGSISMNHWADGRSLRGASGVCQTHFWWFGGQAQDRLGYRVGPERNRTLNNIITAIYYRWGVLITLTAFIHFKHRALHVTMHWLFGNPEESLNLLLSAVCRLSNMNRASSRQQWSSHNRPGDLRAHVISLNFSNFDMNWLQNNHKWALNISHPLISQQ